MACDRLLCGLQFNGMSGVVESDGGGGFEKRVASRMCPVLSSRNGAYRMADRCV